MESSKKTSFSLGACQHTNNINLTRCPNNSSILPTNFHPIANNISHPMSNISSSDISTEISIINSSISSVKSTPLVNKSLMRDVQCEANGKILYSVYSDVYNKSHPSTNISQSLKYDKSTETSIIVPVMNDTKSLIKNMLTVFSRKKSLDENYSNSLDFIESVVPVLYSLPDPQIVHYSEHEEIPNTSILINVNMSNHMEKGLIKKYLKSKKVQLDQFYFKSINSVAKHYLINGRDIIVFNNQQKTNNNDLIHFINTITSVIKHRAGSFVIGFDIPLAVNYYNNFFSFISNTQFNNIKFIFFIPINNLPSYKFALSSRFIFNVSNNSTLNVNSLNNLNIAPLNIVTTGDSPTFFQPSSEEMFFKNSIIEIMFYLKYSKQFTINSITNPYLNTIKTLPYSASSLASSKIYVYDNFSQNYVSDSPIDHSCGFDGEDLVKFNKDSRFFETNKKYIYCTPATEVFIDPEIYENISRLGFSINNITIPEITSIQGVPGCGKSTWIYKNHQIGTDLVLSATREGISSIKDKVMDHCESNNIVFNSIKNNYKTIASYLVNGSKKYNIVMVDEYLMVHAGLIGLISVLSGCSKLILLGDKNQIPYIDRLNFVDMKHHNPNNFISKNISHSLTYRCPSDVVVALKDIYGNFETTNQISKSVTYSLYTNMLSIPILEDTLYLTFLKKDKTSIVSNCNFPSSSKVLTIHEAQGLTYKNVVCIRISSKHLELYDSLPHLIVALTRHTESFKYLQPKDCKKDILLSYVKKAIFASSDQIKKVTKPTSSLTNNQPSKILKLVQAKSGSCDNISFYFQNVNRMSSKAPDFYNFVLKSEFSCYLLCETNLNSNHLSSEFFPSDYIVYRGDRSIHTSHKKSGGGVLIAVKSEIPSESVNTSSSQIELSGIKMRLPKFNIYIFVVYIPPLSPVESYVKVCDSISDVCTNSIVNENDIILLVGDFNLPNVTWNIDPDSGSLLPSNITSEVEMVFIDTIMAFDMQQINYVKNSNGKLLDLIFCNELDLFNVSESQTPFVINDVHHKAIEFSISYKNTINNNSRTTNLVHNYNKINRSGFIDYLDNINWLDLLDSDNINDCVASFYDTLFIGIERNVPITKSSSIKHPPWFDNVLINLKNKKNKAYRRMLRLKNSTDYESSVQHYNESYKNFTLYYNSKFSDYLINIQTKIKNDPNYFWQYFKSKRVTNGLPSTINYDGKTSSNYDEISNMFSKFFQSVYKPSDINRICPRNLSNNNNLIDIPVISEDNIILTLDSFKVGCGPDKIPSTVLKQFSASLALPLSILFNKSLTCGIFPEIWKTSKITPIFKSGLRTDVTNYRGIANSSSIPKLFEAVVVNSFREKVSRTLHINQHGFLPGKSTSTNLVEFSHFTINAIEQLKQVDVIHTDFSKAFDSCSHAHTLESLYDIGFSRNFISWIKSYLIGRTQFVEIEGHISKLIHATSGVPQGSHLGPWLFIIFINNLSEVVNNSHLLLYADDVKIFRIIDKVEDARLLQDDLNRISAWCNEMQLDLNINKCKQISMYRKLNPILTDYYINDSKLIKISEVRDLGVTFTYNMSFNKHIDLIIAKANQMLGFIKRWTKDLTDIKCILIIYFAYVRSQLEYAVPVWNPYYDLHINRIESIQKKFMTFLYFKCTANYDQNIPFYENVIRMPSYPTRCKELNILSLVDRRKYLGCCFIVKILQGNTISSEILQNIHLAVPGKLLRKNNFLEIKHHRTNYGMNEPINSMSINFNEISHLFDFNITLPHFFKILKDFYVSNY